MLAGLGALLVGWAHSSAGEFRGEYAGIDQAVTVAADWCTRWQQGPYEVWYLRGNCYFNSGLTYARGPEAVVWIQRPQRPGDPAKVLTYFESGRYAGVTVDFRRGESAASQAGSPSGPLAGQQHSTTWFGRFETTGPLRLQLPPPEAEPTSTPAIYDRGLAQFDPQRRQQLMLTQFTDFAPVAEGTAALPPGMRRFSLFSRNDSLNEIQWRQLPNGQRAAIVTGGVRLLIEGLAVPGLPGEVGPVGVVDISTDRAVIWASGIDTSVGGAGLQTQDAPLEVYLEGNIEFRQGDRIVYADRMFYDVQRQLGVILNAELLTPLPEYEGHKYQGLVRLKAGAIKQLDASHFVAQGALLTTSRLEEPAYHFGADEIVFEDLQRTVVDPRSGAPLVDSTGAAVVDHQQLATSRGNRLYLRGIPVFYWPTFATNLEKPSFLVNRIRAGNDSILGTQFMVDWDAYQLFGVEDAPEGTEANLSTDYFSDRGIGLGSDFKYSRDEIFGFQGPAEGVIDSWSLPKDQGTDNLGFGRRSIIPEEDRRFRLYGRHRQRLDSGWEATGELGWISDRTFLEQFYEQEWDELKSPRTGVRLKRVENNRALSIEANAQVNDFFTETQWLPRADHYWLGESLLGDWLTWFEHSQLAYADINNATAPTEPTLLGQFTLLPWEAGGGQQGERLVTRQEIDLPLQVGVVKVVPFALGELARWGEALDGDSLQRAYVHTGVRASVPFWAIYPEVQSTLLNLNGLAHKVVWDAEFSYADANKNYDELPLYDPLDDTSITEFRRRIYNPTLGPTVLATDKRFDPRFYALRSGMQGWVTAPATEIADDLVAFRTGMRHRWQTKRGAPGRQHIVDWLTLDANVSWFPEANRDNFGQELGLLDYDLRWHVGDRFTIVSDGAADFFGSGLRTVSAGVLLNRPTRGNAYVGVRTISGPVESNVLTGSYSYRLSEKWISTASASIDFSDAGNIGQTFGLTRIGESLLVGMGINVDEAKDNVGLRFVVEPRFLPRKRFTRDTGIEVPPAGVFGLE
jgi:hypothetical protein